MDSIFTRAKKAFVAAGVAGAGALIAGWLSGHHVNWSEGADAALTVILAWLGTYGVTNGPRMNRRRDPVS